MQSQTQEFFFFVVVKLPRRLFSRKSEVNEFCLLGETAHLRLAVHLAVGAGAFKVQLVVEDKAGPTQTGPVRVLERTVLPHARA